MADMLLDLTVFEDYRDGHAGARTIMEKIIAGEATASVASPTVFDLWRSPGFDRRVEIRYVGMLSFLEEAPLSVDAARRAGVWLASVPDDQRETLTRPALIAAIAGEREEPVCTRDPTPFSRFYSNLIDY